MQGSNRLEDIGYCLQVLERFTQNEMFKAAVVVPKHSLPSDLAYGIEAPATDMVLYWQTFVEASQEIGAPSADHVPAISASMSDIKL